jgi:hypothetical protein
VPNTIVCVSLTIAASTQPPHINTNTSQAAAAVGAAKREAELRALYVVVPPGDEAMPVSYLSKVSPPTSQSVLCPANRSCPVTNASTSPPLPSHHGLPSQPTTSAGRVTEIQRREMEEKRSRWRGTSRRRWRDMRVEMWCECVKRVRLPLHYNLSAC